MKNKSELLHEVESLNLVPEALRTSAFTKEGLMDLLAKSHRENKDNLPPLLTQLPVMLARKAKDLNGSKFDDLLENKSGLWIAEEKLDGVRAKLHLCDKHNRIDSRHRSDISYEYVEKTNCLPHLKNLRHFIAGTVLDGELIMPVHTINFGKTVTDSVLTSTTATVNSLPGRAIEIQEKVGYCRFFAFDILFYHGGDVRQLPYSERYELLCSVQEQLIDCPYLRLPTRLVKGRFVDFFKTLVKGGGEGIMLKRNDWPYEGRKRSKGLYKLKKEKDMDCFVTGFVPGKGEFSGLVGALLVSVMDRGDKREVAAVQPGDLAFRAEISLGDGSLCDDMYDKVVEVTYLCKTKNKRLRHAVLKRFRPDKNMNDCKGV